MYKVPATGKVIWGFYVDSEDPDQTAYPCSLIWVFSAHLHKLVEYTKTKHTLARRKWIPAIRVS